EEAYGDPALGRVQERSQHEGAGIGLEADVVQRDVERPARIGEEAGDAPCDVGGPLPSVSQRVELDSRRDRARRHPVGAAARIAALCARFAAWYSASAAGESILPRQGCSGTSSCAASIPNCSASTEPSPVIFISPNPGSAPILFRRSAASAASVQTRDASPPYSSATTAHSSCTRFAIAPGKRWIAGRSRKAASRRAGSIEAIVAASSEPTRSFSFSGPENAVGTVTC